MCASHQNLASTGGGEKGGMLAPPTPAVLVPPVFGLRDGVRFAKPQRPCENSSEPERTSQSRIHVFRSPVVCGSGPVARPASAGGFRGRVMPSVPGEEFLIVGLMVGASFLGYHLWTDPGWSDIELQSRHFLQQLRWQGHGVIPDGSSDLEVSPELRTPSAAVSTVELLGRVPASILSASGQGSGRPLLSR